MFSNELDKLLVLHLSDLDEGVRRLHLLEAKIGNELDKLVREWSSDKGWRAGDGTWVSDGEVATAPQHWLAGDTWNAWFNLGYQHGDDGEGTEHNDYFWLTRLCAEGRGGMGFRFEQNEFPKTQWKKVLQRHATAFADTRFILDDNPSLFLPVKVDKERLAEAAEQENVRDALTPIVEALDYIYSVVPRFDELRDTMRKEQAP